MKTIYKVTKKNSTQEYILEGVKPFYTDKEEALFVFNKIVSEESKYSRTVSQARKEEQWLDDYSPSETDIFYFELVKFEIDSDGNEEIVPHEGGWVVSEEFLIS